MPERKIDWKPSEEILNYIMETESFHPKVYRDGNGIKTIGYGFIDPKIIKKYDRKGSSMSKKEAEDIFRNKLVPEFVRYLVDSTENFHELNDRQRDALFSYIYNIGYGSYTRESPGMHEALKNKDWESVAKNMDFGYNDKKNKGLRKRRNYERELFGFLSDEKGNVYPVEERSSDFYPMESSGKDMLVKSIIGSKNILELQDPISTSRGEAFREARKRGDKTFEWNGKKYTTDIKEEGGRTGDDKVSREALEDDVAKYISFMMSNPDVMDTMLAGEGDLVQRKDNTDVQKKDAVYPIMPYNENINDYMYSPIQESPYARKEEAVRLLDGLNNTVGFAAKGAAYVLEAPYTLMQVMNLARGASVRTKAAKVLSDNIKAVNISGIATDIADFIKDPSYENLAAIISSRISRKIPDLARPLNKAARSYGVYDTSEEFYKSAKDAYEELSDSDKRMEYGGTTRYEAEDYIFSYLTSNGFKEPQAIAIIANLIGESGLQANITRKGGSDFGLQQWIGPRKKALYEYAREMGHEEPTFDDQLDFLIKEYKGEVPGSGWNFQTKGMNLHKGNPDKFGKEWDYYQYGRSEFENADSVAGATVMYNQGFGRAYKQNLRNDFRIKQAERLAEKFGLDTGLSAGDDEDRPALTLAQNTPDQILPESDYASSSEDKFDRWFEDYGKDFAEGIDYGRIGDEVSSSLQPLISKMGSMANKESKEEDNAVMQNRDVIIDNMIDEALAALNYSVKGMSKSRE